TWTTCGGGRRRDPCAGLRGAAAGRGPQRSRVSQHGPRGRRRPFVVTALRRSILARRRTVVVSGTTYWRSTSPFLWIRRYCPGSASAVTTPQSNLTETLCSSFSGVPTYSGYWLRDRKPDPPSTTRV